MYALTGMFPASGLQLLRIFSLFILGLFRNGNTIFTDFVIPNYAYFLDAVEICLFFATCMCQLHLR